MATADAVFVDAGVFIGALLGDDPRHAEARPLVESARRGEISWCTSAGVLAEVYAALTWAGAQPAQPPDRAAEAVRLLVLEPSNIRVLDTGRAAGLKMLDLAKRSALTGRRVHDARHARHAAAGAPGSAPDARQRGRRSHRYAAFHGIDFLLTWNSARRFDTVAATSRSRAPLLRAFGKR